MEVGETVQQGAAREAREEANAQVEAGNLLTMYDVPRIGQVCGECSLSYWFSTVLILSFQSCSGAHVLQG